MAKLIYENVLDTRECIKGFIVEGEADISFHAGAMRLKNAMNSQSSADTGVTLWCPISFPSDIMIQWEFRPLKEPGSATIFFAAKEKGEVINSYNISYFRRKEPSQRAFHTCVLEKNYDSSVLVQGADPIPYASSDADWYSMVVVKKSGKISFFINELRIFEYEDDGMNCGDILTSGSIGLGQVSSMVAEYKNLSVTWI